MPVTDAFLDRIGTTDRGDSLPLGNCAKALVELADFLIETARGNLDKGGNMATGDTASSMVARDIIINGSQYEIDIEIASTYKFLDQGVKGVESGSGKYSFKSKYPNAKMAAAIRKWLKVRKVVSKYKAYSTDPANKGKTERKNKRIKKLVDSADGRLMGLSYAIATNIKKKGIKPTKFFSKAIDDTEKLQKEKYAAAFKLDIIESLNKN